ncbi:AI-2E family transporter [Mucilaginibacter terrae]|uniref:PurR-regulated permease PerM n=1 Tax=Mucilaginibacter terrae TaxID=1955052 RepID=A0ABU3GUR5_9SPHI|nr:AI-2E family transporter [Mucilaginibacter terrae]MDT3403519.1 putative PurR-regulated permease PerM [Mucilaginibacter terrae]
MPIFSHQQRNNIVLVSIIVLGCFLLYALSEIFSSILGAIVLYVLFRPLYLLLTEKRGWNSGLSAIVIMFTSLVVIVIPFLLLSFMVIEKIISFKTDAIPLDSWIDKIDMFTSEHFNQPRFAEETLQKLGSYAAELFPSILGSAASIILTLLVMYFILYFMFVQLREFEARMLRYAPFSQQHALKFADALRSATYSNVLGQGIISLVQGVLLANGFWIVGIPDAVFWGVIATFISFLPVVGAPTLSIPAGIYLMLLGRNWAGIGIMAYGLLFIGNLDHVLRMVINKRIANTHPAISIIGVFIGLPLFGILGLVFGPVLLSYFILLTQVYETNRMAADRLERVHVNPGNT